MERKKGALWTKNKIDLRSVQVTVFMVFTYIIALCIFSKNTLHIPYGDGAEYVMMTESFYNHLTPDLKKSDATNYLNYLEKHSLEIYKEQEFRIAEKVDGVSNFWFPGYYKSEANGNWYSYHFWMYSAFCVPARFILDHIGGDIRLTGLMTNLFLVFWGMWLILRMKFFSNVERIFLALLLFFSPCLWYIDWIHTEVFSGVLTFMAMVYYFTNRKYLSLFLFSMAATQNPALFVPALFVFVELIYRDKIKLKVVTKLFFCSFWIVLPAIFYKYNFGVTSLIGDSGVLSWDVVSLRRLWGFFFDLNQGVILGIPVLLLLIISYLVYDIIKKQHLKIYYFLLSILGMSLFFMQMTVWNDGNAVIKRYAVWCISIIMVIFFMRIRLMKKAWFFSISILVILSQITAIFSQQKFYEAYWYGSNFSQPARFVMDNFPGLYNPEPIIFKFRLNQLELSSTDSVLIYTDSKKVIKKVLVKEGSIGQFKKRGLSDDAFQKLKKSLNYRDGYAYINKAKLDDIGYVQKKDTLIEYIEKTKKEAIINKAIHDFRSNPYEYDKIVQLANERNILVEDYLVEAANYLYNIQWQKFKAEKGFGAND